MNKEKQGSERVINREVLITNFPPLGNARNHAPDRPLEVQQTLFEPEPSSEV